MRIALVTDGISRLTQNPLHDEELHTFVLGDLSDEERAGGTVAVLKQWSDTFRRIWKTWFGQLLAPRWDDCQAAAALLAQRLRDRSPAGSDAATLRRLLKNVRHLLQEHKRSLDREAPAPPNAQALEEVLNEAEQALSQDGDAATAQPDGQRPVSGARRRVFRLSAAAPSGEADSGMSFWAFLAHWVVQLCRRLLRR